MIARVEHVNLFPEGILRHLETGMVCTIQHRGYLTDKRAHVLKFIGWSKYGRKRKNRNGRRRLLVGEDKIRLFNCPERGEVFSLEMRQGQVTTLVCSTVDTGRRVIFIPLSQVSIDSPIEYHFNLIPRPIDKLLEAKRWAELEQELK